MRGFRVEAVGARRGLTKDVDGAVVHSFFYPWIAEPSDLGLDAYVQTAKRAKGISVVSIIHSTDNRECLNPWGHAVICKWTCRPTSPECQRVVDESV